MVTYLASPVMDGILFNWLQLLWRKANHPQYLHLFDIWIKNITPEQISGFRHNMFADYINHEM